MFIKHIKSNTFTNPPLEGQNGHPELISFFEKVSGTVSAKIWSELGLGQPNQKKENILVNSTDQKTWEISRWGFWMRGDIGKGDNPPKPVLFVSFSNHWLLAKQKQGKYTFSIFKSELLGFSKHFVIQVNK